MFHGHSIFAYTTPNRSDPYAPIAIRQYTGGATIVSCMVPYLEPSMAKIIIRDQERAVAKLRRYHRMEQIE